MQVGCTINYGRTYLWKDTKQIPCGKKIHVAIAAAAVRASEARPRALTIHPTSAKMIEVPRTNTRVPENGPVAQLGARFHGMEEVVGSIPTRSTIFSITYKFTDQSVGSKFSDFTRSS